MSAIRRTTPVPHLLRRLSTNSAFFHAQQAEDFRSKNWGRAAENYQRAFSAKYEAYADEGLTLLRAGGAGSVKSLLDVGCGTGAVLSALANHEMARDIAQILLRSSEGQHIMMGNPIMLVDHAIKTTTEDESMGCVLK